MYIITDLRIDLNYPIWNIDSSKEVAVVSMFGDNVRHQLKKPLKVLLIKNETKQLPEGVFTDREQMHL